MGNQGSKKSITKNIASTVTLNISDYDYNGFETPGGNYIWGGALGLAWNQIIEKFTKQKIEIISNDPKDLSIVEKFNNCKFSKNSIDSKSIYIKSGFGQQTVTLINKQSKQKFPQKSFQDLQYQLGQKDIISYAYLLKKIQFKIKFQRQSKQTFMFQNQKCQSFYAKTKEQKQQINCYYYKGKDSFMISIGDSTSNDMIFLIKEKDLKKPSQVIKKIEKHQKEGGCEKLEEVDQFRMPVIDLDINRNVTELQGKEIKNKLLEGYVFSVVYEAIKLKVDQAGAKVQNQAVIILQQRCMLEPLKPQPRYFILDKRFWIVFKQKGKHPYFFGLINNPKDN